MSYSDIAILWQITLGAAILLSLAVAPKLIPFLLVFALLLPFNFWTEFTLSSYKTYASVVSLTVPLIRKDQGTAVVPKPFLAAVIVSGSLWFLQRWLGVVKAIDARMPLKIVAGTAVLFFIYCAAPYVFRITLPTCHKVLRVAVIGTLALAIYAIIQQGLHYTIGFNQPVAYSNERLDLAIAASQFGGLYRSAGIFVEPKVLADELVFGILCAYLYRGRKMLSIPFAAAVCSAGILCTLSTGGIVALALLLSLGTAYVDLRRLGGPLAVAGILALSWFAIAVFGRSSSGGFLDSSIAAIQDRTLARLSSDTSEQDQLRASLHGARVMEILFGSGYGTYTFEVQRGSGTEGAFTNIGAIRMVVETGLVGVASWVGWIIHLVRLQRRVQSARAVRAIRVLIVAACYALIIDTIAPVFFVGVASCFLREEQFRKRRSPLAASLLHRPCAVLDRADGRLVF